MKKRFTVILTAAIMAVSLLAGTVTVSAAEEENFWEKEGEGRTIGLTVISFASGAWTDLANACEQYTRPGDKVMALAFDESSEELTRIMEDMVTKQYDAIVFTAHDPDAVQGPMEAAAAAGIPLFNIDSPADDQDAVVTYIGTDNYTASYEAGQLMAEGLGDSGKIAEWSGTETAVATALYERAKGFEDAIAEHEGIEIIAHPEVPWPWNIDNAMGAVEASLQANPEIEGIFVPADILLDGVVQAFENANIEEPKIISLSTRQNYYMIEEGKIYGMVDVQYDVLGKTIMEAVYKYLDGGEVDKLIYSPTRLVTKDNLAEIQAETEG